MDITLSDFFEFNPFDNKINSAFLNFLPETTQSADGKIDSKEEFWRLFYYDNTNYLTGTTKELIESIRRSNNHFIIFKGPSGSGKTTYINNIVNKKDDFFKDFLIIPFIDIVNLIEHPYTSTTNSSLLMDVLICKIIDIVDSDLIRSLYSTIATCKNRKPKTIRGKTLLVDSYMDFVDVLGKCEEPCSEDEISTEMYDYLKDRKDVSDMISLYIIFYIFKNCITERKGKHFKPAVFIFDNLDELEFKYLARSLSSDIYDAFSKVQGFFKILEGTDSIAGEYDFISHCTLIESVREGFVATINNSQFADKIANQKEERIEIMSVQIQFDVNYPRFTYNIAKKRFELFRHYMESIGKSVQEGWFNDEKILEEEKSYIEKLSKLFNNDYRMTLSCLSNALTENTISWGNMAKNDSDCVVGIRNFLLFHTLKALYKKDTMFNKYVSTELKDNSCNKNRMYMSFLTNLYYNQQRKNDSSYDEDDAFSLREFTNRVIYWYRDTPVRKIYETVFVSNNNNYSIPAILEGNIIEDYFRKNDQSATLAGLCTHLTNLYLNDPDELNDIGIVVNPVCLAYTEDVFINFEYFNLISSVKRTESLYRAKSLFQYDTYDDIKACLMRVYNVTQKIIKRADKHVCASCGECYPSKEKKENGCTKRVKKLDEDGFLIKRNFLYKTRVINSHINYLDSCRKMMWLKYHEQNHEMNVAFHDLFLNYINMYFDLFYDKDGVINKAAEDKFQEIKKNYDIATSTGCEIWTPISIGL